MPRTNIPASDENYAEIPAYDGSAYADRNDPIYADFSFGSDEAAGITFEKQHIDEYTDLGNLGNINYLSGEDISANLSVKFSGCIDRAQLVEWSRGQPIADGVGFRYQQGVKWVMTDPPDRVWVYPDGEYYTNWTTKAGIVIGRYKRSQTWYDPDQGKSIRVSNLVQYEHQNGWAVLPGGTHDPVFNAADAAFFGNEEDDFGGYGDIKYLNPFEYSSAEKTALNTLFGFEYGAGSSDDTVRSMTAQRMQAATDTLVEDMMTEFVPRADITRRTPQIHLRDSDFEKITGKEIVEDASIATNIGFNGKATTRITEESIRQSIMKRVRTASEVAAAPDGSLESYGPAGDGSGTGGIGIGVGGGGGFFGFGGGGGGPGGGGGGSY